MPLTISKFIALFLAGFVILTVLISGGVYLWQKSHPAQVACTQEAKQCPDGSYVGRTGPNCEFAPCPSETLCEGGKCPTNGGEKLESGILDTSTWKTYRNEKYRFEVKYPQGTSVSETDNNVHFPLTNDAPLVALNIQVNQSSKASLDEFAKRTIDQYGSISDRGKIQFQGIPAIQATQRILGPETMAAYFKYLIFIKDGREYLITASIGAENFLPVQHQRIEMILSTFKFIQ